MALQMDEQGRCSIGETGTVGEKGIRHIPRDVIGCLHAAVWALKARSPVLLFRRRPDDVRACRCKVMDRSVYCGENLCAASIWAVTGDACTEPFGELLDYRPLHMRSRATGICFDATPIKFALFPSKRTEACCRPC